jgi:hypothetical protein
MVSEADRTRFANLFDPAYEVHGSILGTATHRTPEERYVE